MLFPDIISSLYRTSHYLRHLWMKKGLKQTNQEQQRVLSWQHFSPSLGTWSEPRIISRWSTSGALGQWERVWSYQICVYVMYYVLMTHLYILPYTYSFLQCLHNIQGGKSCGVCNCWEAGGLPEYHRQRKSGYCTIRGGVSTLKRKFLFRAFHWHLSALQKQIGHTCAKRINVEFESFQLRVGTLSWSIPLSWVKAKVQGKACQDDACKHGLYLVFPGVQ